MPEQAKMGRPTKYTDDTVNKSYHYIKNYKECEDVMPSVAGLAVELGVARSTIYEWADDKDKKEFSDMLVKLLSSQERILFNMGLSGAFNASIDSCIKPFNRDNRVIYRIVVIT